MLLITDFTSAEDGHVDVAKVLLENTDAVEKGHVDVAKVLIQNGADVNAVDSEEMDSTSRRSLQRTY